LLATLASAAFFPASALAGPSAEVARKCMHYSYVVYPCVAKEGNIAVPEPPKS
jgi:hypothetical protein